MLIFRSMLPIEVHDGPTLSPYLVTLSSVIWHVTASYDMSLCHMTCHYASLSLCHSFLYLCQPVLPPCHSIYVLIIPLCHSLILCQSCTILSLCKTTLWHHVVTPFVHCYYVDTPLCHSVMSPCHTTLSLSPVPQTWSASWMTRRPLVLHSLVWRSNRSAHQMPMVSWQRHKEQCS